MSLLIELDVTDEVTINKIAKLAGEAGVVDNQKSFDGISEVAQIIVPMTTIIATAIVKILKARIAAKAHVSLRWNGNTITGVNEANLAKVMNEILAAEKQPLIEQQDES